MSIRIELVPYIGGGSIFRTHQEMANGSLITGKSFRGLLEKQFYALQIVRTRGGRDLACAVLKSTAPFSGVPVGCAPCSDRRAITKNAPSRYGLGLDRRQRTVEVAEIDSWR